MKHLLTFCKVIEVSTEDAFVECHSTEDNRVYFNLSRQLKRRGPGGRTVEDAVGRDTESVRSLYFGLKRENQCLGTNRGVIFMIVSQ